MSKWIKKDLFETFQKEKIEEKDTSQGGFIRSNLLWETPKMGTVEQAKVYEGRFVPDPKGEFYKKYYYHFWKSGDDWKFVLCPKTNNFKDYCPFCSAVSKLYNGTKQDKAQGYNLKRKEKFVGNFYIAKDNRDEDRDEEKKVLNKIKLYEFPSKVEQKLKNEITDRDEGYGMEIFDPSENGRNFIIRILATKKDDKGKQWPDYSSSEFSRRQSSLGSDEEIEALMQTCTDLAGYLDSMETSKDKQVEILKNEFLWELVEDECLKNGYFDVETSQGGDTPEPTPEPKETPKEEPKDEAPFDTGKEPKETPKEEPKEEEKPKSEGELDDDDLLAELDKL